MKNLFKKLFSILLIVSLFFTGCTSTNDFSIGKKQLEHQGYTDIKDTGYNWFCCDEKDTFSTDFTCKDKNENIIKDCICSGIGKNITIRFE